MSHPPVYKRSKHGDWLTLWAAFLRGNLQIIVIGSCREPPSRLQTFKARWLAHVMSRFSTWKPSNHRDRFAPWAVFLPEKLRLTIVGSLTEPSNDQSPLKSRHLAHQVSRSALPKSSHYPAWLTTWAVPASKSRKTALGGSLREPSGSSRVPKCP